MEPQRGIILNQEPPTRSTSFLLTFTHPRKPKFPQYYKGVQNWLSKQEMELSKQEMELSKQEMELTKQEMELFLPLLGL